MLLKLPNELLGKVIGHLGLVDLDRLSRTNHELRELIFSIPFDVVGEHKKHLRLWIMVKQLMLKPYIYPPPKLLRAYDITLLRDEVLAGIVEYEHNMEEEGEFPNEAMVGFKDLIESWPFWSMTNCFGLGMCMAGVLVRGDDIDCSVMRLYEASAISWTWTGTIFGDGRFLKLHPQGSEPINLIDYLLKRAAEKLKALERAAEKLKLKVVERN